MNVLVSSMSNSELLDLYGYEPYGNSNVSTRWKELTTPWSPASAYELGDLRQLMLQIHKELYPEQFTEKEVQNGSNLIQGES